VLSQKKKNVPKWSSVVAKWPLAHYQLSRNLLYFLFLSFVQVAGSKNEIVQVRLRRSFREFWMMTMEISVLLAGEEHGSYRDSAMLALHGSGCLLSQTKVYQEMVDGSWFKLLIKGSEVRSRSTSEILLILAV
jgi:hypothetical protein